jgi:LPPG:FO 2-phospho-L-lactate transferase
VVESIADPECRAILMAPSNPFLSIDPILAVPAIRRALLETHVPIVAVSPLVGGTAVKGPTAKIMRELNMEISAAEVARHYAGIIDAILIDSRDPPVSLEVKQARADTTESGSRARRSTSQTRCSREMDCACTTEAGRAAQDEARAVFAR